MKDDKYAVYMGLYDLVQKNIEVSGRKMEFKQETFLSTVGEPGLMANVLRWRGFDKDIFLEVAYWKLLERLPDRLVLKSWAKRANKNDYKIQTDIISTIVNSQEYLSHNTYIINNVFTGSEAKKLKLKFILREYSYRFYKKLPFSIKQIIRKILRVN